MERKMTMTLVALLLSVSLFAQKFDYKWQRVRLDTTYESAEIYEVDRIVAAHQEQVSALMEILVYSEGEIVSRHPESALSNLSADMLLYFAEEFIDNDYPTMSMINFGGIRSNFPAGYIRLYDVYSTFPFENSLAIAEISGKEIRRIMDKFASRERFEALGGVEIVVTDKKLEKCLIEGQELEDDKMYNLVTIDFLIDGGDKFYIGEASEKVIRTDLVLRDLVEKYLRNISKAGKTLVNKGDSRIIINK